MENRTEEKKAAEPEKQPREESRLIAAFKFVPLLVFALLVIVFKLDLLIAGPLATFAALAVYMIIGGRKTKHEISD